MKCFIDANVLFSGANKVSQLHRFLISLFRQHHFITSDYAHEEAIRNIRAKRADWEDGFIQIMRSIAVLESVDRPLDIAIASKDRPILATDIPLQCDRLITGDKKDFGHLFEKNIQGATIVTPLIFAQELGQQRG